MLKNSEQLFNKNKSSITSMNQLFSSNKTMYVVEAMVMDKVLKGEGDVNVLAAQLKVSVTSLLGHLNRMVFTVKDNVVTLKQAA